jgi:hypothetical protein
MEASRLPAFRYGRRTSASTGFLFDAYRGNPEIQQRAPRRGHRAYPVIPVAKGHWQSSGELTIQFRLDAKDRNPPADSHARRARRVDRRVRSDRRRVPPPHNARGRGPRVQVSEALGRQERLDRMTTGSFPVTEIKGRPGARWCPMWDQPPCTRLSPTNDGPVD